LKGIERQILRVVREMGKARAVSVARRIGMQPGTVEAACRVLVEDGYLLFRKEANTGEHFRGDPEAATGPGPSPIRTLPTVKTYVLSEAGRNAASRTVSRGLIPVLKGGGW